MTRRITLLFLFLFLCASSAWPKFKDDELKQLDDKFQPLMDQLTAMQTQIQALNTQLQQLKDNQTQLQTFVAKQQRTINEINQLVSSMTMGDDDHYSKLKGLVEKLSSDTQASFKSLGAGVGGPTTPVATNQPAPTLPTKPTDHYVTAVNGEDVVVDFTSADGIQQGARLGLYKASDPSTRVGVLEVTQVLDTASHARILSVDRGVKAEFGDSVRVEK